MKPKGAVKIWTRAAEDWAADSEFLDPDVLSRPCVGFTATRAEIPKSESFDSVIITSKRVLDYLDPQATQWLASQDLVTFGRATAEALSDFKVRLVSEARSAAQLAATLDPEAVFCVLGPEQPAFDWGAWQNGRGRYLGLYRTTPIAPTLTDIRLTDARVAFASPSAVEGFLAACPPPCPVVAIVIGSTTADACGERFSQVVQIADPNLRHLAQSLCV